MSLKKDRPIRVIFMDLDRTLIEPIPFPEPRVLSRKALHSIGNSLDELYDNHNTIVVIVTNKPAGRVHDIAHTVLGKSAWNRHFAESGAVCIDLASYSHHLHPQFDKSFWVNVDRPQILAHLAREGLNRFEGGNQMVNIILVNPQIANGVGAPEFAKRVQAVIGAFNRSHRVCVSHGEEGNLADISPQGYGKHLAAQWAYEQLTEWAKGFAGKIEWDESYVFGDGASDATFLDTIRELCGVKVLGACPANASKMMLDRSDLVSTNRVEEGTAENLDLVLKSLRQSDRSRSINAMRA